MLTLKIISPEKTIYDGPCVSVKVPGTQGEFEVLNDHAPIISSLETGKVEYVTGSGKHTLEIEGGFVSVRRNEVNVCVET